MRCVAEVCGTGEGSRVLKSRQQIVCVRALMRCECYLVLLALIRCARNWLYVVHASRKLFVAVSPRGPSTVGHTWASCVHESEWGAVLCWPVELHSVKFTPSAPVRLLVKGDMALFVVVSSCHP
jgi:hypothetical protein